jgi:casein kinase II subunit beta
MIKNTSTWIRSFVFNNNKNFLLEIPLEFIEDSIAYSGLKDIFVNTSLLVKRIKSNKKFTDTVQDKKAALLYIYLHQRYLLTTKGAADIYRKIKNGFFGKCSCVNCEKNNLIPVGISDDIKVSNAWLYCYKCGITREIDIKIDGAAYGLNFIGFIKVIYRLRPIKKNLLYNPKLFGFETEFS